MERALRTTPTGPPEGPSFAQSRPQQNQLPLEPTDASDFVGAGKQNSSRTTCLEYLIQHRESSPQDGGDGPSPQRRRGRLSQDSACSLTEGGTGPRAAPCARHSLVPGLRPPLSSSRGALHGTGVHAFPRPRGTRPAQRLWWPNAASPGHSRSSHWFIESCASCIETLCQLAPSMGFRAVLRATGRV